MAPTSHFRKAQVVKPEYATCAITRYVSDLSGMQVYVIDREGPKVEGYFVLATEVLDDSGAPHTLEHLVFMGTKNYPYRALLDKVASRLFSETNAWTDTHHTCYTLNSVGWEAFGQILPVYLEHILIPNITDASVTTEVWHIGADGKDGGVVYSEMQANESKVSWLLSNALKKHVFPPEIGYRYETGGLPPVLRTITRARIEEFHREMYKSRNLGLVIAGHVDHEELLRVLDAFEDKIKDHIEAPSTSWKRPWVDSAQPGPLTKTVVDTIEFPEEDESTGEIVVMWYGPGVNQLDENVAAGILSSYLAGYSISVLNKALIEDEQLASDLYFCVDGRVRSLELWVYGIKTALLEKVRDRVFELLAKAHDEEPLDMTFLRDCIRRARRQTKWLADGFSSYFTDTAISDMVWGPRDGSMLGQYETMLDRFAMLEGWSEPEWKAFMKKWLLDPHSISVMAKPSRVLAAKRAADEEARLTCRREELGEEGIREAGEKVARAKEENSKCPPDDLLRRWTVPNPDGVSRIPVESGRAGTARDLLGPGAGETQSLIDQAAAGRYPLFIMFNAIRWNFVHISIHFTATRVPRHLLPLVDMFVDNFFKSSVVRDGVRFGYEEVVKVLNRETVSYEFSSGGGGSGGGDPNSVVLSFTFEPENYATVIGWAKSLIADSTMDPDRVMSSVSRTLADIPDAKRDGDDMADEVLETMTYGPESLSVASGTLAAAAYVPRLKTRLQAKPTEVTDWLEQIRAAIFTPDNCRVLVVGDVAGLKDPVAAWDVLTSAMPSSAPPANDSSPAPPLVPLVKPRDMLTSDGLKPGAVGVTIVPIAHIDSSYLKGVCEGLLGYDDPRTPIGLVAGHYLQLCEGPLWTSVRGNGLAYGACFRQTAAAGLVRFMVYRSPNAAKAFIAARDMVAQLGSGETPIDPLSLEAAVSQVVSSYMEREATPQGAATQDWTWEVVRGLPPDTAKRQLAAARKVTADQVREFIHDSLVPAFTPGRCNIVVACATVMVETLESDFREIGFKTTVRQLADFHNDYGIEPAEGVEIEVPGGDDDEKEGEETGSESGSEEDE